MTIPMLDIRYGNSGHGLNALGQRPMQARAYKARAAQYLLLKAPPASGKSRALMFIALDKMRHQGRSKTIICVPETSIGASFQSTDLMYHGFEANWEVEDQWNLCLTGDDVSAQAQKTKIFTRFLKSDAKVLVCTHATFRLGCDIVEKEQGFEAFDECFIAIDEFHHVSASDHNRLGRILRDLMKRDCCHIMAMTGSYFRGDTDPVLRPEDEDRFKTIIYSYYEQLESYRFLKALGINYEFYKGNYINGLDGVLDETRKTIIHIPHRGSSEAFDDKGNEVGFIIDKLGKIIGRDPETGFDLVQTHTGRMIRVADLVDDGSKRDKVKAALAKEIRGPDGKRDDSADRAKVDVIIALGMAKEGFDWVWCEHALTIGYRSSLTEIVQIIGRATRDAPGKKRAIFTNLVAEPGVATESVTDAVNDMLKAISGSLLMEQVLAPNFRFYRREDGDIREPISSDNEGGVQIGIRGLKEPPTARAREICEQDMDDLMAMTLQKASAHVLSPGTAPEVVNQMVMADIIERKYENLDAEELESVRQHLAARMNLVSMARREQKQEQEKESEKGRMPKDDESLDSAPNTLLEMVKKFINVRELDIELIDKVNVFQDRFEVASKSFDPALLSHVQSAMVALRVNMTGEEAAALWERIKIFRKQEGREPDPHSDHPLEKRMAEALAWLKQEKARRLRDGGL